VTSVFSGKLYLPKNTLFDFWIDDRLRKLRARDGICNKDQPIESGLMLCDWAAQVFPYF
jgi:hypothetical protein